MTNWRESGHASFVASGAIGKDLNVKLDSNGKTAVAGVGDKAIGITTTEAFAADEHQTVRLFSDAGTFRATANGTITAGDYVVPAASGKWTTSYGPSEWIAVTAASADADIIEITKNYDDLVAVFSVAGATAANLAVKFSAAGTVALAGADEAAIGVTLGSTAGAGTLAVKLLGRPFVGTASQAMASVGAYVLPAASGKWALEATNTTQFVNGTTAAGDGSTFTIYHASQASGAAV